MNDITLEHSAAQLGALLQKQKWYLVTAESCTGGWIAQTVTTIAGSSNWFERGFITSTRRLVETVISQLTQRFNIQKVWARDLWHLTHRITRKLLSHSIAVLLNRSLGYNDLQFDRLIK